MKSKEHTVQNVILAAMEVVTAWTNEEDLKKQMTQLTKHLSEYAIISAMTPAPTGDEKV